MHALILAAGFGTRMGALTKKTAKPLLPVASKPVIEHIADRLMETGRISGITVVTNRYYHEQFDAWTRSYKRCPIRLIDNGATCNENRRGAIADLSLAADKTGSVPLMVMAADNIFSFDLSRMLDFFEKKRADVVAAFFQPDLEKLKNTGVASIDGNGCISSFEEKPEEPKGTHAVPCLYVLLPETVALVKRYLAEGEETDAPGNLIAWLYKRVGLHAFCFDEPILRVGDIESYEETKRVLEK